jgi:hypothetical protein
MLGESWHFDTDTRPGVFNVSMPKLVGNYAEVKTIENSRQPAKQPE